MKLKRLLVQTIRTLGLDIGRYRPEFPPGFVSLRPDGTPKGSVLLAYILEPFRRQQGEPVSTSHTHHLESVLIAETWRQHGYRVDVIDYRNDEFIPTEHYDFFVSARTNFEHIARLLNHDCIKIAHLDTAHFLFNNQAAYKRAVDLQKRRGITCPSIRLIDHNLAIERADFGAILGNVAFTFSTYAYANKPLFALPVPAAQLYALSSEKDYDAYRKDFLWFGSGGFVHKGLDLVLEVFAQMPDYHLTVCGPIAEDADFLRAFDKELYRTPNIHTIGWVDLSQGGFLDIASKCLALIYPSCSEGQSGAVVTCMHAGLIPILSHESGVDVHDFGVLLKSCSVDEIQNAVRELSGLPVNELRRRSQRTWEYARDSHTQENYAQEYRKMILQILSPKNRGAW